MESIARQAPHASAYLPTLAGNRPESLPGQPELKSAIRTLLRQRKSSQFRATLVLLQLANFYEIRTWVGKAEAHQLLSDLAEVLCSAVPASVQLYHCDNYEFALLLCEEASDNAASICQKLQRALQSAVSRTLPSEQQLHCVAGLAAINRTVSSADVLLARARHNLNNPGQRQAESNLQSPALARLIVKGIRQQGLSLNFQACLGMRPALANLIEVRSAMTTASGLLPGGRLFDTAVQNALGEALDRCVINQCLEMLASDWDAASGLLINLSLNSLVSSRFHAWLPQRLQRFPGLAKKLTLQISELDIRIAQHHLAEFGRCLEAADVALSLNHFSATSESMGFLPLLDCKLVKLDYSVLTDKLRPGSARLQALTDISRQLHDQNIAVLASRIEDITVLPGLWRAGLDYIQGNCLQPAGATAAVPAFQQIQLP